MQKMGPQVQRRDVWHRELLNYGFHYIYKPSDIHVTHCSGSFTAGGGGGGGVIHVGHHALTLPRTLVLATCSPSDATALIVPAGTPSNLDSIHNGSAPKDDMTTCRTWMYTSPAIATFIHHHASTRKFLKKKLTERRHNTMGITV
jgi:hypothetical protein